MSDQVEHDQLVDSTSCHPPFIQPAIAGCITRGVTSAVNVGGSPFFAADFTAVAECVRLSNDFTEV